MGMEDDVLSFYSQQHVDGIVIEALGNLRVPLVKAYMGMEDDVLSFYSQQHVDGIVIEALGQGNLPKVVLMDYSNV